MLVQLIKAVRRGRDFMDLWPTNEPVLKAAFREVRVTIMLNSAKIVVPPIIALLLFFLYYSVGGLHGFKLMFTYPQAFTWHAYMSFVTIFLSIALVLIMVLLGYVWMAVQSMQPLDGRQLAFYRDLMAKLGKQPEDKPQMFHLAKAINDGCKNLKDKSFLERI